jgi:hypothetical protein
MSKVAMSRTRSLSFTLRGVRSRGLHARHARRVATRSKSLVHSEVRWLGWWGGPLLGMTIISGATF